MSYNEDKTEWKIGGGYVPKMMPCNYIYVMAVAGKPI